MSIATDENVRQLLKRMATLEEKVKQLEAARDAALAARQSAKTITGRAKALAERFSEI